MGFLDAFKGNQYKSELETLQTKYDKLIKAITPEMQNAIKFREYVDELKVKKSDYERQISTLVATYQKSVSAHRDEIAKLNAEIDAKKQQIISFDETILIQEFGLYSPRYDFITSDEYKAKLAQIRNLQKECIQNEKALSGNVNWTVNDSVVQGRKMLKDMQKLLLRAFNSECDETIGKIKYNNLDASIKKINSSAATISKLGTIMKISITAEYLNLKIQEAYLAMEYQLKKQQEKEDAKEARAQMREAAKLQREIEEQRKRIEKEQNHYQAAFEKIQAQLELNPGNKDLLDKKAQLEDKLSDVDKALAEVDYRQANMKAGYVYVISNIGAFGENVYKIGMTRRLDPQERIDELGDASVPFNFDVHAMIFSDDAPALENALHHAFEDKKVNMVNQRREFFNVTLEEIKKVVKENFDKTVEFVDIPDAEQYRISQKMKSR